MPPAYTAEQIARAKAQRRRLPARRAAATTTSDDPARGNGRVEPPSDAVSAGARGQLPAPAGADQLAAGRAATTASRSRPRARYYRGESGRRASRTACRSGVIPERVAQSSGGDRRTDREPAARQPADAAPAQRLRARKHRRPHGALDHAANVSEVTGGAGTRDGLDRAAARRQPAVHDRRGAAGRGERLRRAFRRASISRRMETANAADVDSSSRFRGSGCEVAVRFEVRSWQFVALRT